MLVGAPSLFGSQGGHTQTEGAIVSSVWGAGKQFRKQAQLQLVNAITTAPDAQLEPERLGIRKAQRRHFAQRLGHDRSVCGPRCRLAGTTTACHCRNRVKVAQNLAVRVLQQRVQRGALALESTEPGRVQRIVGVHASRRPRVLPVQAPRDHCTQIVKLVDELDSLTSDAQRCQQRRTL